MPEGGQRRHDRAAHHGEEVAPVDPQQRHRQQDRDDRPQGRPQKGRQVGQQQAQEDTAGQDGGGMAAEKGEELAQTGLPTRRRSAPAL